LDPISSASVISIVDVGPAGPDVAPALVGPAGPFVGPAGPFVGPAGPLVPAGEPVPCASGTLLGSPPWLPADGGATTGPVILPGDGAACPAGLCGKSHKLQYFLHLCLAKPMYDGFVQKSPYCLQ